MFMVVVMSLWPRRSWTKDNTFKFDLLNEWSLAESVENLVVLENISPGEASVDKVLSI